jgi:uncharacterized protein (TIGR00255 family)
MTGFGRADASDGRRRVAVEIKTVNHRYSDINIRMPRNFSQYEDSLRRLVQSEVRRGRVDMFVTLERAPDAPREVAVDLGLAQGYYRAMEQLRESLGLTEQVRLEHLLRAPDVLTVANDGLEPDDMASLVLEATRQALGHLGLARSGEGQALAADLLERLARLSGFRSRLAALASGLVPAWRDRLLSRLSELLGPNDIDAQRIAQEVALYADRSDISEELVRLGSHIQHMRDALESPPAEQVGRRLDFICQEMLREVNTIGSKAVDTEVSGLVISAKEELERIREQIQNIE